MIESIGVYIGCASGWRREIEYTLRFLFNAAGVRYRVVDELSELRPFQRVLIYADVERERFAALPNQVTLYIPCLIHTEEVKTPATRYREKPVDVYGPYIQFEELADYPYTYKQGGSPVQIHVAAEASYIKLGWDLIGAAFHLLNLSRERGRQGERLQSPAPDEGCSEEPAVDRYVLHLAELLDLYQPGIERMKRWPEDAPFAVALTHDVDMLRKWRWRTRLKWTARLPLTLWRDRAQLRRDWREMRAPRDPWDNCAEVLRLEREYGFNSSWFFLTEARDHQTFRYQVGGARARSAIQAVKEQGGEVGLHGGYRQAHTPSRFLEQKHTLEGILERELQGVRQHWLRFSLDKTWDAQSRAGFQYDSSLGWNHCAGYRCGTSLPFPVFDPIRKQESGLYEIPLICMDTALFYEQGLPPAEVTVRLNRLLDTTAKAGGLLTVLFHNHYFYAEDFPGWEETYRAFLAEVKRRSACVDTLRNIVRRWQRRRRLLEENDAP